MGDVEQTRGFGEFFVDEPQHWVETAELCTHQHLEVQLVLHLRACPVGEEVLGFPKPAWETWMRVRGKIPELGGQGETVVGFGTGPDSGGDSWGA